MKSVSVWNARLASDLVKGRDTPVPGHVDVLVTLEYLKGAPLGMHRMTRLEALRLAESLIRSIAVDEARP